MIFQILLNYLARKRIMPAQINASNKKVAIIGGGVSGATAALYLSEQGFEITLFEQSISLVNGPPMCHLHAGGNLYRELPDQECITLLKESIEFARFYPNAIDPRPTLVAIPLVDKGMPEALLPRLALLKEQYKSLVDDDANNEVLGHPDNYFSLYTKEDILKLKECAVCEYPKTHDEWMIPVAQNIDLEKLKFPLIMVNEFGINLFQVAASATLAIEKTTLITLSLNTKVTNISFDNKQWHLDSKYGNEAKQRQSFDYLINACGFESGILDDLADFPRDRFIEFKAAYLTRWDKSQSRWPEVVFYGDRGSKNGMGQFTPYANGYFQLHGMSEEITLFNDGLIRSTKESAYPKLPDYLLDKVKKGWIKEDVKQRTESAISHLSKYIPSFECADVITTPLFGIQQIPGDDPDLRATGVSFDGQRYARCEIVKASSVVSVAHQLSKEINAIFKRSPETPNKKLSCDLIQNLQYNEINNKAKSLAKERGFPSDLALLNN